MERISPTRAVTQDEVATFWRDGVVCLRSILPVELLESMAEPIEEALVSSATTDLSEMADALESGAGAARNVDELVVASGGPRGHFKAGTDHWLLQQEFRDFALRSPLPEIVASILRSDEVRLYEDSVLVKEPGTQEKTGFHQDMAYFHLDGDLVCTTWVPLDIVTAETGAVRFVVGSHLDNTKYRPNMFVSDLAMPDTEGAEVPDYDKVVGQARIISFDTSPGDLTVHHARTIHAASGNMSRTQRRRAISVRYTGDGTRFKLTTGSPTKEHHSALSDGDFLDDASCPLAWP
ncbi:COG5285 Protein involved in biosynthesis of mitomycin antibiotics/polyketide fumonisin [Acidimicrobiia bacterium]